MLFSTTAGLNWSQTIKSRHFKVLWSHHILRKDVEKNILFKFLMGERHFQSSVEELEEFKK